MSEKQLLLVEICLLWEGSQSWGSKTIPTVLHSIYYLYSAYCCSHGVLSSEIQRTVGSKGGNEERGTGEVLWHPLSCEVLEPWLSQEAPPLSDTGVNNTLFGISSRNLGSWKPSFVHKSISPLIKVLTVLQSGGRKKGVRRSRVSTLKFKTCVEHKGYPNAPYLLTLPVLGFFVCVLSFSFGSCGNRESKNYNFWNSSFVHLDNIWKSSKAGEEGRTR